MLRVTVKDLHLPLLIFILFLRLCKHNGRFYMEKVNKTKLGFGENYCRNCPVFWMADLPLPCDVEGSRSLMISTSVDKTWKNWETWTLLDQLKIKNKKHIIYLIKKNIVDVLLYGARVEERSRTLRCSRVDCLSASDWNLRKNLSISPSRKIVWERDTKNLVQTEGKFGYVNFHGPKSSSRPCLSRGSTEIYNRVVHC